MFAEGDVNLTKRWRLLLILVAPIQLWGQTWGTAQDSYVIPGSAANYGQAGRISVGNSGSQGLLQFDLSVLPAGVLAAQVQKRRWRSTPTTSDPPGR